MATSLHIPSPVVIVRHGETAGNVKPEHIRGWSNIPLDAKGVKAAELLGDQLKSMKISAIYSSDLQRAMETADHIQAKAAPDVEIIPLRQLRPWNVGIYTGMQTDQVIPQLTFYLKHPDAPVPQGESFDHFVRRFIAIFLEILGETRYRHNGARIIVTHSRDVRVAMAYLTDGESAIEHPEADRFITIAHDPVPPGHALILSWTGEKWQYHTFPGTEDGGAS